MTLSLGGAGDRLRWRSARTGTGRLPRIPATSIPADGGYVLSAVVQDLAGNLSTPTNCQRQHRPPALNVEAVATNKSPVGRVCVGHHVPGQTELQRPSPSCGTVWQTAVTANGAGVWSVDMRRGKFPPAADIPLHRRRDQPDRQLRRVRPALSSWTWCLRLRRRLRLLQATTSSMPEKAGRMSSSLEPASRAPRWLVTWAGQTANATVDAGGNWQTSFAPASVPGNALTTCRRSAGSGRQSPSGATTPSVTVDTAPAPLAVTSVAGGDNLVSLIDAGSVAFSGTAAPGAALNVCGTGWTTIVARNGAGAWSTTFSKRAGWPWRPPSLFHQHVQCHRQHRQPAGHCHGGYGKAGPPVIASVTGPAGAPRS